MTADHQSSMLELEHEGGITSISLRNADRLIKAFGKPGHVQLAYDEPRDEQLTIAQWNLEDGRTIMHTFTGFSWGYGGEGPHGLLEFLNDKLGMLIPFSIEEIARWDNDTATIGFWLKGVSYR